ncbi:MAG: Trk system potassium transporter TrkA [Halothiobacillaceae bacterium]|nr:MAG: Trk system potassium transporter TrkA [Halothiobacillaceae bacterium]
MKIVILGAGQVGTTAATQLASEPNNDITLVDTNAALLRELQEKLDIRTVTGLASHPSVLAAAGVDDADMLLAVTHSDEVNMVACQLAWKLFHTPVKIARLRAPEYKENASIFEEGYFHIDVIISPETLIQEHIARLVAYPGSLQVLDFAGGRVRLVGVRAVAGGPMVGHPIRDIREHMPNVDTRVAAIFRRGQAIMPAGDTVIQHEDEVFFIAAREHIRAVMAELGRMESPYRRIMIAGGGNIGRGLAKALESRANIKVIEHNPANAKRLAEELHDAIVLRGDATDEDLLREENVEDMDLFLSVTNDDENNILSAMLAKRLGARKAMAIINRTVYVDLIESSAIDVVISPQLITVSALLAHLRRGDVTAAHSLRRGAAEAMEIIAVGDRLTSRVVGRRLAELKLPEGVSIGALVRDGDEVIIAHGDTVIESDDHVILFLTDKRKVRAVEQLFQVGFNFFG